LKIFGRFSSKVSAKCSALFVIEEAKVLLSLDTPKSLVGMYRRMFSVSTLAKRQMQRNLAAPTTRSFSSVVPDKPDKDIISKRDIVQEIAETHDLTLATSERIVNSVLDTIVQVRGR
jgi:hypothetical protein